MFGECSAGPVDVLVFCRLGSVNDEAGQNLVCACVHIQASCLQRGFGMGAGRVNTFLKHGVSAVCPFMGEMGLVT